MGILSRSVGAGVLLAACSWVAVAADVAPPKKCINHAMMAYFAAGARDRGITQESYLRDIRGLRGSHPELAMTDNDIEAIKVLVIRVWATKISPDRWMDKVLRECNNPMTY